MDEKAIKELAIKIANESAFIDNDGSWWGHNTDIGDLPSRIETHLEEAISETKKAIIEEIEYMFLDDTNIIQIDESEWEKFKLSQLEGE